MPMKPSMRQVEKFSMMTEEQINEKEMMPMWTSMVHEEILITKESIPIEQISSLVEPIKPIEPIMAASIS